MSTYYPNVGENHMLKSILMTNQMKVGLFKNVVSADGGVTIANFTEWTQGGGRLYVPKTLQPIVNDAGLATGQFYVATNASGKASAQWCEGAVAAPYLEWEFGDADVADLATVYGAFAYSRVLPFDSGGAAALPEFGAIKVGDIVRGATGGAYATVTAIMVTSGTWAAGTAAGVMAIKDQTGAFQDNEAIQVKGRVSMTGLALSGQGSGAAAGDIYELSGFGGQGALFTALSAVGGAVKAIAPAKGGCGYSATGIHVGTRCLKGAGAGVTANISALDTTDLATTNTGSLNAGDSHQIVMWMETFSQSQLIDTSGQKIRLTVNLALSST